MRAFEPKARKRRAGAYKGPRAKTMQRRLVAMATDALARAESDPVRILGLQWYPSARAWCADLARRYAEHGATLESIIGAVAALSPQVAWTDQARFVPMFLESVLVDKDFTTLPHPGFLKNRMRAGAILRGADPKKVLSGPKVCAFFQAIMGDRSAVVVDRHAATVALGERKENLSARLILEIQKAYKGAAECVNVDPRALQSLLWCHYKAIGAAEQFEAPLFFEGIGSTSLPLELLGLGWGENPLSAFQAPDSVLPSPDYKAPLLRAERERTKRPRAQTTELPF